MADTAVYIQRPLVLVSILNSPFSASPHGMVLKTPVNTQCLELQEWLNARFCCRHSKPEGNLLCCRHSSFIILLQTLDEAKNEVQKKNG
ncbi:hypothetical protein OIDMADRAFT_16338 [Oidiodendron maius Zn]|uniref:Uncharacterized protein n=1 Tax=Oidiodendron maius (strain Zn) TaxID=913774 RepID=A0A0C3I033_OIDMZ|nr:hypothetical protein OIDMADRAFT_16338 [Oidiodendron maius Zn]